MSRSAFFINAIVFSILVLAVVGFVVPLTAGPRLDLTEEQIHTLSPYSLEVLEGLTDKIYLDYWVSKKVPPNFRNARRDISDFLKELGRAGGDRVEVQIRDPLVWINKQVEEAKEAGEEEEVEEEQTFGGIFKMKTLVTLRDRKKIEFSEEFEIPELRGTTLDEDSREQIQFYSGLRIRYLDNSETIPTLQGLQGLEYEVISRIVRLVQKEKPVVAFFHGRADDVTTQPPDPRMPQMPPRKVHPYSQLIDALRQQDFGFDVREIELTESSPIPFNAALLVVAQPKELSDRQVYEIDRFVAQGGDVVFFASRYAESASQFGQITVHVMDPGLDALFSKWGVRLRESIVSSQSCGYLVQRGFPREYPVVPASEEQGINSDSPLTQQLNQLFFPYATAIDFDEKAFEASGLERTLLAETTESSWTSPSSTQLVKEMFQAPEATQSYGLVYLLEGTFPALYPEGSDIPSWPAAPEEADAADSQPADAGVKAPPIAPQRARVVICSSADFAKVQTLSQYQENGYFLLRSFETLSLGPKLIDIRSKTLKDRKFVDLEESERKRVIYGNVFGVPLALLLFGLFRWFVRRTVSRGYESHYLKTHRTGGDA